MIKAHIETEIAPIVGSEQQAEDLITYIKENAAESEDGIWNTNIFGSPLSRSWRTASRQGFPGDRRLPDQIAGYVTENY